MENLEKVHLPLNSLQLFIVCCVISLFHHFNFYYTFIILFIVLVIFLLIYDHFYRKNCL